MSKKLYPRSMKSRVDECSVYESLGLNYPAVRCVAHTNVKWEHARGDNLYRKTVST